MPIVAIVFVIAVGGLGALIASRPDQFRLERSARIDAPSDVVFAFINDFREWAKWSPWEKLDPAMKRTYGGANTGVGATYAWDGNKKAGEGHMAITESVPNERLKIELVFTRPFAARNQTFFRLTPVEGGTQVTWSMEGKNMFINKAFSLLVNMDALVGKDFERGLANLNTTAQGSASTPQPTS